LSKYKDKLVLPTDHMIINEFKDPSVIWYQYTENENIPDWYEAIDIWPKWVELFVSQIANAKTIVWNWPVWVFEWETSAHWTKEVWKAIAKNTAAYRLIWGGDSIAAVNSLWLTGFDHICTWWGAMLAYIWYDEFPTLDIILK
jgi:phosphoglycerate kinase